MRPTGANGDVSVWDKNVPKGTEMFLNMVPVGQKRPKQKRPRWPPLAPLAPLLVPL